MFFPHFHKHSRYLKVVAEDTAVVMATVRCTVLQKTVSQVFVLRKRERERYERERKGARKRNKNKGGKEEGQKRKENGELITAGNTPAALVSTK